MAQHMVTIMILTAMHFSLESWLRSTLAQTSTAPLLPAYDSWLWWTSSSYKDAADQHSIAFLWQQLMGYSTPSGAILPNVLRWFCEDRDRCVPVLLHPNVPRIRVANPLSPASSTSHHTDVFTSFEFDPFSSQRGASLTNMSEKARAQRGQQQHGLSRESWATRP